MGKLMAAFAHSRRKRTGVFESSQNPIVVGQAAYNTALRHQLRQRGCCNATSNPAAKCDGFARIAEQGGDTFKFDTLSRRPDGGARSNPRRSTTR